MTHLRNFLTIQIDSWPVMVAQVRAFFSPQRRNQVDHLIPGWQKMAAYAEDATLVHVMAVMASLLRCPEYRVAPPSQQALMQWIVLLHDIDKKVVEGQRDPTHPFRCAAKAGPIVAALGFGVTGQYAAGIEEWSRLALTAETKRGDSLIPDNGKLPEILAGIEVIFGRDRPSGLLVETILLHQSINVVEKWPQAAPLSATQARQYIRPALWPLLRIMMLVDNEAWNLFDQELRDLFRGETLRAFAEIERR